MLLVTVVACSHASSHRARPSDGAVDDGQEGHYMKVRSVFDNSTGELAFLVSSSEPKRHTKRNIRQEQSK